VKRNVKNFNKILNKTKKRKELVSMKKDANEMRKKKTTST